MDDVHLHPLPLSVDDSDLLEAFLLTFEKIVLQERRDFPRREGVEIDPVLDGNFQNHKSQFGVPKIYFQKFHILFSLFLKIFRVFAPN